MSSKESVIEHITFRQSRIMRDYDPLIRGLTDIFAERYIESIEAWCQGETLPGRIWEIYQVLLGSRVIGQCGLYSIYPDSRELWLGWLGFVPEERGKGRGKYVVYRLLQEASELDAAKLMVYVEEKGPVTFYYKLGFSLYGTVRDYLKENPYISEDRFGSHDDLVMEYVLK